MEVVLIIFDCHVIIFSKECTHVCIRDDVKAATNTLDWDESDLSVKGCVTIFNINISHQVEADWNRLNDRRNQLVNDFWTL